MTSGTRLPVVSWPLWSLLIIPILIATISIITISLSIDPAITTLGDVCSSDDSPFPELSALPVIGVPCCALSAFFSATVASAWGKIFMSIFLSFITALVTTTLTESQREDEVPNAVVLNPAAPWLLVNIISGAVVAPLVMAPASFHHSRKYFREGHAHEQNRTSAAAQTVLRVNRVVRTSAKVAIPLSVSIGFIIPSVLLVFAPSPITIILWQFFPVYVSVLLRLLNTVINKSGLTLSSIDTTPNTSSSSAGHHGKSSLYLFSVPTLSSLISHLSLVIYPILHLSLQRRGDVPDPQLTKSALQILALNFITIYITFIYWLYVEGGVRSAASALRWTLIAGPGAGVCHGWIAREEAMRLHMVRNSGSNNNEPNSVLETPGAPGAEPEVVVNENNGSGAVEQLDGEHRGRSGETTLAGLNNDGHGAASETQPLLQE
jgi:hypothetical protein